MKTPKRTKVDLYRCPECGSFAVLYDIKEKKEYLKCKTCGFMRHKSFFLFPAKEHAVLARWIRKNREARLKHALREMKQQLELQEAETKGNIRACAVLRRLLSKEIQLAAQCSNTIKASNTYGQDIEGS